jgi:hypothetical protein
MEDDGQMLSGNAESFEEIEHCKGGGPVFSTW